MSDNPNANQNDHDLPIQIKAAADARDVAALVALLDPLPLSEALRELLHLSVDDRVLVLSLVPAELAAELIEEAPSETAADLVEGLTAMRAAEIMDELDSDVQADLKGDLDDADAEAILSEMDDADAADVRRLATYDNDTAGGLMVAEAFSFSDTQTVGKVLRDLASGDDDFERYRGQHPYTVDEDRKPIGVVSLRGR